MLKWLKIKWSLWKVAVLPVACNAILSLICYAIGWHLSCATSSMPLARAGAAATAFAIGFALYDYRARLLRSEQAARETMEELLASFTLTGPESLRRINEKLEQNTAIASSSIAFIQTAILILATIVWGFGDLIPGG